MSKHRLIREAIAAKIESIVGSEAKVLGLDERDGNERTWPGRLTHDSGLVYGYVIRWSFADQQAARTPQTSENVWNFEIKAYRSKTDADSIDEFYDDLEAILFSMKPETQIELEGGSHVRVGPFRWEHKEQSPQEDVVLLYSIGTITVRFREGC